MEILPNRNNNKRFDIKGISESGNHPKGIAGSRHKPSLFARIFRTTTPILAGQEIYYLNRRSLKNWYGRVNPGATKQDKQEFSKNIGKPKEIHRIIQSMIKKNPVPPSGKSNNPPASIISQKTSTKESIPVHLPKQSKLSIKDIAISLNFANAKLITQITNSHKPYADLAAKILNSDEYTINEKKEFLKVTEEVFKQNFSSADFLKEVEKKFHENSSLLSIINKLKLTNINIDAITKAEKTYPAYTKFAANILNSNLYTRQEKQEFLFNTETVFKTEDCDFLKDLESLFQAQVGIGRVKAYIAHETASKIYGQASLQIIPDFATLKDYQEWIDTGTIPLAIKKHIDQEIIKHLESKIASLSQETGPSLSVLEFRSSDQSFFEDLEQNHKGYKKFADKVLNSPHYSDTEKKFFLQQATSIYKSGNRLIQPTEWIDQTTTVRALHELENQCSDFKVIGFGDSQAAAENLNPIVLMSYFPPELPKGSEAFIYSIPLQVNGNHRTAFIVDFKNKSVEYFNSFGDDSVAKPVLEELAQVLRERYGVPFSYDHKTKTKIVQKNGYDCGAWSYIFIVDRVKLKENFSIDNYEKFPIADYRKEMFLTALKYLFHAQIGQAKMVNYIKTNYILGDVRPLNAIPPFARSLYFQWYQTGVIPKEITSYLDKNFTRKTVF